jgi:beta-glucosidase-like glycosyl hydrolase/CubicO group peptidase (beta-lactamase class C family)
MTLAGRASKSATAKPKRSARDSAWVEKTLKSMSLREKLGQLLVVYYFGEFTSTESAEYKDLVRQVTENRVGGFILGTKRQPLGIERGGVYVAAVLANQLQKRAKVPLIVSADFERGTAMRLDEGTGFPSAMAIATTGNPQDAYTVGKVTALEARAAGIQWIFAPDADVNDNPDNPIINVRSFGEDPLSVARYVSAFVRGVQENGGLATAKHFPGHGDVSVDSHIALATVPGDRKRLESVELVPFRAAIAAGVGSIMTGHLAAPAFEPNAELPATMSPNVLTGLLRNELGFDGLIVTDALDMGGVTTRYPPGEAAVRSVLAGADVLLLSPTVDAALEGLEEAAKSGRLPVARIDESVRRILRAKERLGLAKNRLVDVDALNAKFGKPEFGAAAQDIADRGVTLLRNDAHALPLDATKPLRLLVVALSGDPDPFPGSDFEDEIRNHVDSVTVVRADTQFSKVESLNLPPPETYDAAIAGIWVRVADRKGSVGLPDDQAAFVSKLLASPNPVIVAGFGSPYVIERFPSAKTWIAEFSTQDVSQRAVARAIFGQNAISGKIPVTVPGLVKRGDGIQLDRTPMTLEPAASDMPARLRNAFEILDRGVADQAFPGGVLAVGFGDRISVHPFGRLTDDQKSPAVTADTIYDIASLTKSIVTTTAVMLLVQEHRIEITLPISRYLPEWTDTSAGDPNPSWRAKATVRDLLLHASGLPAHRDYYKTIDGKNAVLKHVMAEPLVSEPGTHVEYSDLGFILLGEIVERLTGLELDAVAKDWISEPLGMANTMFTPPKNLRSRIAPTENDTQYRERQLQGEVDDANASAMGNVAGHAGLFSTAGDVAVFAQMMLNGGIYAHHRLLARETIEQFTARIKIGDSARALGWDVPVEPSSTGKYFSARSYGHNGFTGTSLWIDPEKDLFVILLTNRVYPSAENIKIREIRPRLHDAIVEGLGLASGRAAGQ